MAHPGSYNIGLPSGLHCQPRRPSVLPFSVVRIPYCLRQRLI